MRTLIIHIGPHKTGTSFIQGILNKNRKRLYPQFHLMTRRQKMVQDITGKIHTAKDPVRVAENLDEIVLAVRELSKHIPQTGVCVISDEDFLGRLPSKQKFGLYPFTDLVLRNVVATLREYDIDVYCLFYHRNMPDWLASLLRYTNNVAAIETAEIYAFVKANQFPNHWDQLLGILADIFGKDRLIIGDYDQETKDHNFPNALFDLMNLSLDQREQLETPERRNVTNTEKFMDR